MVAMSDIDATQPGPGSLSPVRERIALLDALRGLSIIGIAVVNVLFFAVPIVQLLSWQWDRSHLSESLVRCAVTFLAEYQFFPIFAVLFGMGLAMQYERSRPASRGFKRAFFRRILVLFAFGVAHGVLLWYGDILALYALMGFVFFWFLNRSPRTVLITAVVLFMVPLLIETLLTLPDPYAQKHGLAEYRDQLVTELQARAQAAANTNAAEGKRQEAAAKTLTAAIDFLIDDQGVYRSGTIGKMILHRSVCFLLFSPWAAVTHMAWSALAFMLLGIYFLRRGVFCGSSHPPGLYRRLVLIGMVPGVILQIAALMLHALNTRIAWVASLQFACVYLGSLGMMLGYMGIVYLLYQRPAWQRRLQPLVAVGQMSLTNYIGTSFLFGLIFYGYGLGLIGRVSLPQTELIALAVMSCLTLFSMVWLKYFQYGPLEWLWRVLTYMRFLPIRRRLERGGPMMTICGPGNEPEVT
jgi:uncharacterized protein